MSGPTLDETIAAALRDWRFDPIEAQATAVRVAICEWLREGAGVETVARALFDRSGHYGHRWDRADRDTRTSYLSMATGILAALLSYMEGQT